MSALPDIKRMDSMKSEKNDVNKNNKMENQKSKDVNNSKN